MARIERDVGAVRQESFKMELNGLPSLVGLEALAI